jgi:hypothetical protein
MDLERLGVGDGEEETSDGETLWYEMLETYYEHSVLCERMQVQKEWYGRHRDGHLRVSELSPVQEQHAHAIRVDKAIQGKDLKHLHVRHQRTAAVANHGGDASYTGDL